MFDTMTDKYLLKVNNKYIHQEVIFLKDNSNLRSMVAVAIKFYQFKVSFSVTVFRRACLIVCVCVCVCVHACVCLCLCVLLLKFLLEEELLGTLFK